MYSLAAGLAYGFGKFLLILESDYSPLKLLVDYRNTYRLSTTISRMRLDIRQNGSQRLSAVQWLEKSVRQKGSRVGLWRDISQWSTSEKDVKAAKSENGRLTSTNWHTLTPWDRIIYFSLLDRKEQERPLISNAS